MHTKNAFKSRDCVCVSQCFIVVFLELLSEASRFKDNNKTQLTLATLETCFLVLVYPVLTGIVRRLLYGVVFTLAQTHLTQGHVQLESDMNLSSKHSNTGDGNGSVSCLFSRVN